MFVARLGDPATGALAVTPNDAADLPGGVCMSLWISVAGDVVVVTQLGQTVTFRSCRVGRFRVRVQRVLATGTTATGIVALYQ